MLSLRAEAILKSIVSQYIIRAVPVASQSIMNDSELTVSSATIRNEMVRLEHEGYIIRPHTSAGSIPSDKGYRYYVETLSNIKLPLSEQRLISHLFHQVEKQLEDWLRLAATLIAQLVQNLAIVTMPKTASSRFKYLELVALRDSLALIVLILQGARLRQQLITFDQAISQAELRAMANRLNLAYSGLTRAQISTHDIELSPAEQQVTESLLKTMQDEDEQNYEETYLDGLHFMLSQPEFSENRQWLGLMELVEHRKLIRTIMPPEQPSQRVQVVIGRENKAESIHDYSVVIGHYGPPEEAIGTVGVIGPMRMPYARTISTIDYLSSVLSELVAELYGKEQPGSPAQDKE